jgi:hypothetical protein
MTDQLPSQYQVATPVMLMAGVAAMKGFKKKRNAIPEEERDIRLVNDIFLAMREAGADKSMMAFEVTNGSMEPVETDNPRMAATPKVVVTVQPHGPSMLKVDRAHKTPLQSLPPGHTVDRNIVLINAMLQGVRTYVHERDGVVYVIVTKNEIRP